MLPIQSCLDLDLEQAWKTHRKGDRLGGLPIPSSQLLLFYAVECGLKHLIVRLEKLRDVGPRNGLLYSHDLAKLLERLKPTAAEVGKAPPNLHLTLASGPKRHGNSSDIHLAWRYGAKVDANCQDEIIAWLRQVDGYIGQKRKNT